MADEGIYILSDGSILSRSTDKVAIEIDLQLMQLRVEDRETKNVLWVMDMDTVHAMRGLMDTLMFHHQAIERARRSAVPVSLDDKAREDDSHD